MDMREADAIEDVQHNLEAVACGLECMCSNLIHGEDVDGAKLGEFARLLADVLNDQAEALGRIAED